MEDHILATNRYLIIFLILISFYSTSILNYYMAMTILKLKFDWLFEFLNTTSIPHISIKMLLFDTGSYLSKILWKTAYGQLGVQLLFSFSSFFFYKYSKLGSIFLSDNQSLFLSQIVALYLYVLNK